MDDFRFAWRTLWKTPGFTLVAIAALALGIGANTAMFTIVKAVVLKPLPFPEPDRLVTVWETFLPGGWGTVSAPNLRDWREQNHSFSALAAYAMGSRNLAGVAQPERLRTAAVTANSFDMLGVPPQMGRTFDADEDRLEKPNVAVLSAALWKRRFASDPKAVGRTVVLDGEPHTIVGIMPESFEFPPQFSTGTDVWVPLKVPPQKMEQRGNHWMHCVGRLKPGVSIETASAEMNSIAERLEKLYPEPQAARRVKLQPELDVVSGEVRPILFVLLAAVGAVLLIACANVANLLLARGAVREREIAVRAALGAARTRLIRLLLAESLLIALLGGVAGLGLAYWGIDLLVVLADGNLPRAPEVRVDGGVFLYLLVACAVTALVFGLMPAIRVSRADLNASLREGGSKGPVAGAKHSLRNALVVAELSLAFVLLVSTGALMQTLLGLMRVETGMNTHQVLTFLVAPSEKKYPNEELSARFYTPLLERLRALPGVRAAGATSLLPIQNWGWNGDFAIEGRAPAKPGSQPFAEYREVTTGYFRALGIPLIEGRDVSDADTEKGRKVVLVNQTLAKKFFPGESAMGKHIGDPREWATVVGVVGDVRQTGLANPAEPEIYFPEQQHELGAREMTVAIRADLPPQSLTGAVRQAVQALDPDQPIFGVKTMEKVVEDSVSSERLNFGLMAVFGGLAMLLAAAGVYGVMSYLVSQRTREFGLRIALGAASNDVMRLLLGEVAVLGAVAAGIGVACAIGAAKLLRHFIPGVASPDLAVYGGVAVLLAMVVAAATLVPARRATRVDPMEALRWE